MNPVEVGLPSILTIEDDPVLGAYVHSNRLEFVEYFGKFYEGGGRKFSPLGNHTKYYKIEEETQNV